MKTGTVPAVERTIQVFEAFRAAQRPLSISELARWTKIPVSTCHGFVRTLEQRGLLYCTSRRDLYPTRKLLEIARDISVHDPIITRLAPALQKLRDDSEETIILGISQGDAALYLLVIESLQSVRYTARAGEFKPMHSSAIGKVLLASLPEQAFQSWITSHDLKRATPATITSPERLRLDLQESRQRGYFVTRGENVSDVMAIAMPLAIGSTILGVAIAGPLHRMEAAESRHATTLKQTVRQIQESLNE